MGQIEITDREWIRDSKFWFELDGPVTIETVPTEEKGSEMVSSRYWLIGKVSRGEDAWALQVSNESRTNNHRGNFLNEYPDTPEEVFCRFTSQIIDYRKPISFSPHDESLQWERKDLSK